MLFSLVVPDTGMSYSNLAYNMFYDHNKQNDDNDDDDEVTPSVV